MTERIGKRGERVLKIHGALNSRASRNVWLAMELQREFEHIPVVQATRVSDPSVPDAPLNTATESVRRISPRGRIPVIDDDGLILHESLAINLHLARTSRHGPLAPRNAAEDALMTMWTIWAATECELHAVSIIVNRSVRHEEDRNELAAGRAVRTLAPPMRTLATALDTGGGHPVGERFTVADLNIAEVLRYAQPAAELMERHPRVARWLAACQARPTYRELAARRSDEALPAGWRDAYRPSRKRTTA